MSTAQGVQTVTELVPSPVYTLGAALKWPAGHGVHMFGSFVMSQKLPATQPSAVLHAPAAGVGFGVGEAVGDAVGLGVGDGVGDGVGGVGERVGYLVYTMAGGVGVGVGGGVGDEVGARRRRMYAALAGVGCFVGLGVGCRVGLLVPSGVGKAVGAGVGHTTAQLHVFEEDVLPVQLAPGGSVTDGAGLVHER